MTRLKRKKELAGNAADVRFGTPEIVANHRAKRLSLLEPDTIIEVGAGAGFQTKEFAKIAKVVAVEIDATKIARAELPARVVTIVGDALDPAVIAKVREEAKGKVVIFLDPERPATAERRTLAQIKPNIQEFIKIYSAISPDIAIELPPFLPEIPFSCEREYLSIEGALNRLTVYLGKLATCELSVVSLPSGARFEHDGPIPLYQGAKVQIKFLLDPDAALVRAGIPHLPLNIPYRVESIGNKEVFLTERVVREFYTCYQVLAKGEELVRKALPRSDCSAVIVHGRMEPVQQKRLLAELSKLCKGNKRLHLFLGEQWYLARKA
jgi:hypothetical protein